MVRRFRGEGLNKVDSKGRVSIPALFRRVIEVCDPAWTDGLNPELVIVYGDNRKKFLECYTIDAIDEVDEKINDLPRGSIQRKMLERLFHGQSFPTSVDDTGRLVIPAYKIFACSARHDTCAKPAVPRHAHPRTRPSFVFQWRACVQM